jgi:DNA-binding transcriptional ArsR family regulator
LSKSTYGNGDETRQSILLVLLETDCQTGLRVGEITEQTPLSRPAVPHHLKILRDAGVILMRKEGTKNFYYINVRTELDLLKTLVLDFLETIEIKQTLFGGIGYESNGY